MATSCYINGYVVDDLTWPRKVKFVTWPPKA